MSKTVKVTGRQEINIKRLYLPVVLKFKCGGCGEKIEKDLDSDYLGYPTINFEESQSYWCESCDHEGEVALTLRVQLEVGENT